jgi:hypothetical protein
MPADDRPTFCLTVRQPWAWAIFAAGKDIENRRWKPRRPCRVLIHAGRALDRSGYKQVLRMYHWNVMIGEPFPQLPEPEDLAYGQIIGLVDVNEWDNGDPGTWASPLIRWHWHLTSPMVADPPITVRGQPAFFRPPEGWQASFPGLETA